MADFTPSSQNRIADAVMMSEATPRQRVRPHNKGRGYNAVPQIIKCIADETIASGDTGRVMIARETGPQTFEKTTEPLQDVINPGDALSDGDECLVTWFRARQADGPRLSVIGVGGAGGGGPPATQQSLYGWAYQTLLFENTGTNTVPLSGIVGVNDPPLALVDNDEHVQITSGGRDVIIRSFLWISNQDTVNTASYTLDIERQLPGGAWTLFKRSINGHVLGKFNEPAFADTTNGRWVKNSAVEENTKFRHRITLGTDTHLHESLIEFFWV